MLLLFGDDASCMMDGHELPRCREVLVRRRPREGERCEIELWSGGGATARPRVRSSVAVDYVGGMSASYEWVG